MFTFRFTYKDGVCKFFEHIKEVRYNRNTLFIISDGDILKHLFPIGYDLHLFSDGNNVTVSGKELLYIEVEKEN